MLGKQHRIACSFGERGDGNRHFGQSVVQIIAERLVSNHLIKIAVSRAHDANIDRDRLASADTFNRAFLQKAKQFYLQWQRDVTDFIQEKRAAARNFDLAFGHFYRTGKRALFMPEQFGFE